jgi:integrase/recombinase XerC
MTIEYVDGGGHVPHLSPSTLARSEQARILRATAGNPRDHLIYSTALGTGLRLAEIVGLNVEDVYFPDGQSKTRIRLRPEIAKNGRAGDVFLPDALLVKFRKFWQHKATKREGLRPEDPLFCSQSRTRISPRRVQFAFRTWQMKAGFDRLYPFHALRHTAVTNVYRASRDLFLAQRFARHCSPLTTTVYTHPSDQEMWERVRGLTC